jgi:hypothetical protein
MVSRTASAVATHQSRGVAEPVCRASVETRCRWMSERSASTGFCITPWGTWMERIICGMLKGAVLAPSGGTKSAARTGAGCGAAISGWILGCGRRWIWRLLAWNE